MIMVKGFMPRFVDIPRNEAVRIPWRWIFVDTETKPEAFRETMTAHRFRLGHAIYWRRARKNRQEKIEGYPFRDRAEFWSWVMTKPVDNEPLTVVAHNTPFDMLALDGYRLLAARGYSIISLYVKNATTIIKFARGRKRIVIIDSMNFFPVPLKDLGDAVGLPKLDTDPLAADDPELAVYCQRDAEILLKLFQVLTDWLITNDLGSFAPTSASLAFHIWRHKFMKHPVQTHKIPEVVALERSAYVGGFVYLWRLIPRTDGPFYQVDVNSMYPWVMRDFEYPTRFVHWYPALNLEKLDYLLGKYAIIADVLLETDEPRYPVRADEYMARNGLLVEYEDNLWPHVLQRDVFYPVGTFHTVLCSGSLRYALEHGHIKAIMMAALYRKAPIFREYIDYVYPQRVKAKQAGLKAYDLFYKHLGNDLYGKLGQLTEEMEVIGECEPDVFREQPLFPVDTQERMRMVEIGGSVITYRGQAEGYYAFPAIPAHVTDYARLRLFEYAAIAGIDHCQCSDTDSLIVDASGFSMLRPHVDPQVLGKLKVEAESDHFVGLAKKDYIFPPKVKRKGYRDPDPLLTFKSQVVRQQLGLRSAMHWLSPDAPLWNEIDKAHKPTVVNVKIGSLTGIYPIELPREKYRIGQRIETRGFILKKSRRPWWNAILDLFRKPAEQRLPAAD